ncbi:deoxyribodipyrimidine photolyase, partial [Pseudomonas sp. FW306-02-H06C]
VECLGALKSDLARLGRPLMVQIGDAVDVLRDLHERFGVAALWSHEETGNGWTYARDREVAAWAKAEGVAWREERQFGVVRRLTSRNGWAA